MSLFKDFKSFVSRGNMVDLTIGVVIGGAFGKIISSLVGDIIMPPFGFLMNGIDLKDYKWILKAATDTSPEVAIAYGNFIQVGIEFIIIAVCIFILLEILVRLRIKTKEVASTPREIQLLEEIRDLLKK